MTSPTTHIIETYENSELVESTTITEGPPGTFTYTRRDASGVAIEQRDARADEIAILAVREARARRLAAEQGVRGINRAAVNSSPGVRDAIMALRDLMMECAVTSDDT